MSPRSTAPRCTTAPVRISRRCSAGAAAVRSVRSLTAVVEEGNARTPNP